MSHRPIILGIVGDSAAGKTTLTKGIAQILGEENVTVIGTDDYPAIPNSDFDNRVGRAGE
jgi:phosphoribulokinase